MTILPDFEKLYEPYSEDASLEETIVWLAKQAKVFKVIDEIRDLAIQETFVEMANGKTFPVGSCDCGCEFPAEWSCVAMNHYMLCKMQSMNKWVQARITKILQEGIHAGILAHIKNENDEYSRKHLKPSHKERLWAWWWGKEYKWTGSRWQV